MKDEDKTKEQLINELVELRQRVAELEAADTGRLSAEQAGKRAQKDPFVHDSEDQPVVQPTMYQSPVLLVTIIALLIFVSEVFVMIIIPFLPPFPTSFEVLLDSAFLVILLSPMLYFFLFRPLVLHITERERAEKTLRESEEIFRSISTSAQDAVIMIDSEENISFWNEAAEGMFDYSSPEALGKELHMLLAPERYYEAYREGFGKFKTTGRGAAVGKTLELEAVRKDGTEFPIALSLSAVKLRGKWNAIGIVRDITERKQAEEALRESEEKYRTILETIEDSYFEVSTAGNFTFFNDSLCRLLGYSEDELMGMNNREYMDDENARKVYQTFNAVYRTGESARAFDWEIIRKDGTRRFVEASVSLMRDPTGKPIGFRGVVRDITERKRAEKALRESEERLRGLFETMAEGIVVIAPDGQIVRANPAAERILGLKRAEIETRKYVAPEWEILRPDGTPMPPEEMAGPQAMKEKRLVKDVVMGTKRPDGSISWINVSAAPLINEAGELEGVVGTFADITERMRAEEA
ncbi:MAG: PAS domain S-box protein, partial [Anaerolineae bacterium]